MTRERWIGVGSPDEWRAALTSIRYSFAHTWDYCRAMQSHSGRPTFLYEVETNAGRFVCPIEERIFEDATDAVTPQGFSGFVGEGDSRQVSECWARSACEREYVSGYLVQNPALENSVPFLEGDTFRDKCIYVWDLRPSLEELYAGLASNRKPQVRNWDEVASSLVTNRARVASFLLKNYDEFFARRHASSTHGLSPTSIASLAELDDVYMVGMADGGELTAAAIFAYTSSGGDYLFNVSRPEGRRHSTALVWSGAVHLKSLGVPHLNLGGGLVEGDGIARFKSRFGAAKTPLPVVKQVYDHPRYVELCRRVGADPNDIAGYFPAYRR